MEPDANMREFDFIDWIRARTKLDPREVPVGPGDDCALLSFGGGLLVTCDQVLDGVHFRLGDCGPRAAGYKAMARALSDIAAMAAQPLAAVVTSALPRGFAREDGEALYEGLRKAADPFRCGIVGGDVGVWDSPLAVSVTVLGRPASSDPPVLRSGAAVDDAVCVTGSLGGSWKTGRDLKFVPRIDEALALSAACQLHAMIDLSDGLASDAGHVCRESGVGMELQAAAIPIHPDATGLDAALTDGEDYELLFTLPPQDADALLRAQPLGVPVTRIGTVVAGKRCELVSPDGSRRELGRDGWEHKT